MTPLVTFKQEIFDLNYLLLFLKLKIYFMQQEEKIQLQTTFQLLQYIKEISHIICQEFIVFECVISRVRNNLNEIVLQKVCITEKLYLTTQIHILKRFKNVLNKLQYFQNHFKSVFKSYRIVKIKFVIIKNSHQHTNIKQHDLHSFIYNIKLQKDGQFLRNLRIQINLIDLVINKSYSSFLFLFYINIKLFIKQIRTMLLTVLNPLAQNLDFHYHSDLSADDDFKSISQELGQIYNKSGYNVKNAKIHMIGKKYLEIIECKDQCLFN
ncbi:hypothetical protein pb186bvf_005047 [Paramecium bursaria]